jgi:GxxExxY protein
MDADPRRGTLQTGDGRLAHRATTEKIIGAFVEVYNELGFGFLESVYAEAMSVVLASLDLAVERSRAVPVFFREREIGLYRPDLIVQGIVLVELKAVRALTERHEAQLLNYLRATELEVGLLFNFGPEPTFRRLVFANTRKRIRAGPR